MITWLLTNKISIFIRRLIKSKHAKSESEEELKKKYKSHTISTKDI